MNNFRVFCVLRLAVLMGLVSGEEDTHDCMFVVEACSQEVALKDSHGLQKATMLEDGVNCAFFTGDANVWSSLQNGVMKCCPGFVGSFCTQISGHCIEGDCQCEYGFTGPLCEADIDECEVECEDDPNADCVNTIGSYSCNCHQDYIRKLYPVEEDTKCVPLPECPGLGLEVQLDEHGNEVCGFMHGFIHPPTVEKLTIVSGQQEDTWMNKAWGADKLFDGNLDPDEHHGGCFHTGNTQWGAVTLSEPALITKIEFLNRDSYLGQMVGMRVEICVDDTRADCTYFGTFNYEVAGSAGRWDDILPDGGLQGVHGDTVLFIHHHMVGCEVYVYGIRD